MKLNAHHLFLSVAAGIALLLISSCQSNKKETSDKSVQQLPQDAPAEVTATPLTLVDFEHVDEQWQDKSANSGRTKVSVRGGDCEDIRKEWFARSERTKDCRTGHLLSSEPIESVKGCIGAQQIGISGCADWTRI